MSQLPTVSAISTSNKSASNGVTTSGVTSEVQHYLDVLSDANCRIILDVISTDALTASEISAACDRPLSTTYRMLDLLPDTRLLEEETCIRRSGKPASEYARSVDDIVISLSDRESKDQLILDLFS